MQHYFRTFCAEQLIPHGINPCELAQQSPEREPRVNITGVVQQSHHIAEILQKGSLTGVAAFGILLFEEASVRGVCGRCCRMSGKARVESQQPDRVALYHTSQSFSTASAIWKQK